MKIITSKLNGGYMQETSVEFSAARGTGAGNHLPVIVIDANKTYQTHMGFGAAFTEATCINMSLSGEEKRREVISAYYGKNGNGYTLGRTHINSCDFGTPDWHYSEKENLSDFDISREELFTIPLIKDCEKECGKLFVVASPWSPPAWMKTNGDMKHGGKLKPEYYGLWAEYMARYIEEMAKRGVRIDLITAQNEPEAVQQWESCIYTAAEEAELVKHMAAAFKKYGIDVKIAVVDHNRDIIVDRCITEFADDEVRGAVWGCAYHWYFPNANENLTFFHELFPEKHLLLTECCIEYLLPESSADKETGEWTHAERYGRDIIRDFNNYSEGWIDWNMLLNEQGGPNHVGNYCESPIMYDRDKDKLIYNPSYYYIGHFSRYIRPGAKRVFCMSDTANGLYATAFKNENGTVAAVIQNETDERSVRLVVGKKEVCLTLPKRSIQTLILSGNEII